MEALYVHIATKLEYIRYGRRAVCKTLLQIEEVKTLPFWRAVFAEFLAQVVFVFMGCSSVFGVQGKGQSFVKIALAFGLSIMALIQMVGHVSGGHINPAVSIAMAVAMNISVLRCVFYIVAQCLGAIVGGYLLKAVTPDQFHDNLGCTVPGPGVSTGQAVGVEMMLTFVLVIVIFGTTDPHRPSFGSPAMIIGLTVSLGHLAGIEYTGASMNPSRTLGSAVASDLYTDLWVYWVGPIGGGIIAAIVYKFILNPYKGVIDVDEAIERMRDESFSLFSANVFRSEANVQRTEVTVAQANGDNKGFTTHM